MPERRSRGVVVDEHDIEIRAVIHPTTAESSKAEDGHARLLIELAITTHHLAARDKERRVQTGGGQLRLAAIGLAHSDPVRRIERTRFDQQTSPRATQRCQFRTKAL